MMVEVRRRIDLASTWEGFRDFMFPPDTARPYRILTGVSKAGYMALILAGTVAGIATGNPVLLAGVAMGTVYLGGNLRLDAGVERRNRNAGQRRELKS